MHLKHVKITNFRLLGEVSLNLEPTTTVIVGRNNSGKTSLTELFRRILSDSAPRFALEDFSLRSHDHFWASFLLYKKDDDEAGVRKLLPHIEAQLTFGYENASQGLGALSRFIIDLDPDCNEAKALFRYQLKPGAIAAFFDKIDVDAELPEEQQKKNFCRAIRGQVPKYYEAKVFALDPTDVTNQTEVEFSDLQSLLVGGFINAQRGLDDVTDKERNVLSRILEALLNSAMSDAADPEDKVIATKLEQAVETMQGSIDTGFNQQLESLFPAFSLFGYPGLADPGLLTETTLDVKRLLTNHTKVHYAGLNGINLPEAYNGLGVRNLIYILLKLLEYFKTFKALTKEPGVHLIFIEEPEVHLHPQMQEVFIGKLSEIAAVFTQGSETSWPVQFVVTTHSSHVANKAPFDSMRYFVGMPETLPARGRRTQIKDLRRGLSASADDDSEFLHKYMTLTKCDLLFADKAILIEGTSERLLLPKMIEKRDVGKTETNKLSSQYLSVLEVGGAHAHIFFPLLKFLGLQTLVITDLDTANRANRGKACKVSEGTHTTNGCITTWFSRADIIPSELLNKTVAEKIKDNLRLSYQIPEAAGQVCGRSFEAAFMLANRALFGMTDTPEGELEEIIWQDSVGIQKSDFALEYAIKETNWSTPRYILDGLDWLAENLGLTDGLVEDTTESAPASEN